jgi:hypothetical protein
MAFLDWVCGPNENRQNPGWDVSSLKVAESEFGFTTNRNFPRTLPVFGNLLLHLEFIFQIVAIFVDALGRARAAALWCRVDTIAGTTDADTFGTRLSAIASLVLISTW